VNAGFSFWAEISFFGTPFFLPLFNKYITLLIVKSNAILPNRHSQARETALRKLAQVGPFLEGALCQFKRPGCVKPGWHLTFKQKGRTRTVYVPMELVSDVKSWTRTYKHLKKLIRQVTTHSLALIHRHVANQRAAKRSQALMRRSPRKPS
jgi:hypothetical protein